MKLSKKKGIALISVLLLLMALMVLTMGFVHYTMQDYLTSRTYHQANVCFYLASAGLDYAKYLVKTNMLVYPYTPWEDTNRDQNASAGTQVIWRDVREEGNGVNAGGDSVNDHNDSNPSSNIIDATESLPTALQLPMTYDANNFDGTTAVTNVGGIVNVFDTNGHEHLLVTRLATDSDDIVSQILEKGNTCGTFRIYATEMEDPNGGGDAAKRVLFIRSEGLVKLVPAADWANSPTTWDVANYDLVSKRTLLMRIPYSRNSDWSYSPDLYQEVLSDSWWEMFR